MLGGSPEGSLVHTGGVKRSGSGRSVRKRLAGDMGPRGSVETWWGPGET